jgi:Uma2 family endonuclease
MQIVLQVSEEPTTLRKESDALLDNDRFFEFCAQNPDMRIERSAEGEVIFMPPPGGESSYQNNEISFELSLWARRDGRGVVFDSSGHFILPNGAVRSPDAVWIRKARLEKLTREQKRRHIPICPDFVIELRSPSDRLKTLKAKMEEWIGNGAELAWLIDPSHRTVTVYRPGCEPEKLSNADFVIGEGPVEGFRLGLKEIWAGL